MPQNDPIERRPLLGETELIPVATVDRRHADPHQEVAELLDARDNDVARLVDQGALSAALVVRLKEDVLYQNPDMSLISIICSVFADICEDDATYGALYDDLLTLSFILTPVCLKNPLISSAEPNHKRTFDQMSLYQNYSRIAGTEPAKHYLTKGSVPPPENATAISLSVGAQRHSVNVSENSKALTQVDVAALDPDAQTVRKLYDFLKDQGVDPLRFFDWYVESEGLIDRTSFQRNYLYRAALLLLVSSVTLALFASSWGSDFRCGLQKQAPDFRQHFMTEGGASCKYPRVPNLPFLEGYCSNVYPVGCWSSRGPNFVGCSSNATLDVPSGACNVKLTHGYSTLLEIGLLNALMHLGSMISIARRHGLRSIVASLIAMILLLVNITVIIVYGFGLDAGRYSPVVAFFSVSGSVRLRLCAGVYNTTYSEVLDNARLERLFDGLEQSPFSCHPEWSMGSYDEMVAGMVFPLLIIFQCVALASVIIVSRQQEEGCSYDQTACIRIFAKTRRVLERCGREDERENHDIEGAADREFSVSVVAR